MQQEGTVSPQATMTFREVLNSVSIRSANLGLIVLSVLLGAYVVWSVQSYRRLKHIPGPPIAAWTSWYVSSKRGSV